MTEANLYSKTFGQDLSFMDAFHDYPEHSNIRYYHRLKASIVRDFIIDKGKTHKALAFLDAGGGRGPYSKIASQSPSYGKIHLLEFDADELEQAKKNLADIASNAAPDSLIDIAQADLRSIPLPSDSINVAICSEVLEHIPNEELAIRELFRVLKPGGRILFSMPNASSLFYKRVRKGMPRDILEAPMESLSFHEWERRRHISFSASKIQSIIEAGGFRIMRKTGANVIPLPVSIREKAERHPWLFRAFFTLNSFLGKVIPNKGSFYFLEAIKP